MLWGILTGNFVGKASLEMVEKKTVKKGKSPFDSITVKNTNIFRYVSSKCLRYLTKDYNICTMYLQFRFFIKFKCIFLNLWRKLHKDTS